MKGSPVDPFAGWPVDRFTGLFTKGLDSFSG
jgi:hypothetical protein